MRHSGAKSDRVQNSIQPGVFPVRDLCGAGGQTRAEIQSLVEAFATPPGETSCRCILNSIGVVFACADEINANDGTRLRVTDHEKAFLTCSEATHRLVIVISKDSQSGRT